MITVMLTKTIAQYETLVSFFSHTVLLCRSRTTNENGLSRALDWVLDWVLDI
jgi:hypothetical protein